MIEMSFDKETVLPCEGQAYPTSQEYSELTRNDSSAPHPSGNTTVINLRKEAGDEAESETSLEHREKPVTPVNNTQSESGVVGVESSKETQNGTQQPKPQQQKFNKRRSSMSAGFKHPVYGKRRRRANSESESVLPTNSCWAGTFLTHSTLTAFWMKR